MGLILVFLTIELTAFAATQETVTVYGTSKEKTDHQRSGKSFSSRSTIGLQGLDEILDDEPAIVQNRNGSDAFVTPFAPTIRGQSSRYFSVFVEDWPLEDPTNSFPTSSLYALEALERSEYYYGLSHPRVYELGSAGTLVYRLPKRFTNKTKFGFKYGKDFGESAFVKHQSKTENCGWQLFQKNMSSDGSFSYFSNSGTPENFDDDVILRRKNASLHGRVTWPILRCRGDRGSITGSYRVKSFEQGLPDFLNQSATARRSGSQEQASVSYESRTHHASPVNLKLSAFRNHQYISSKDRQLIFSQQAAQTRKILNAGGLIGVDAIFDDFTLYSSARFSQIQFDLNRSSLAATAGERRERVLYAGMTFSLLPHFQIEFKTQLKTVDDTLDETQNSKDYLGLGLGFTSKLWRNFETYANFYTTKRPISILERFGDGYLLEGNAKLTPEKNSHIEFGARFQAFAYKLTASIFASETASKIIWLPSLPNTLQAINVGDVFTRGAETTFEISLPWDVRSTTSIVYLDSYRKELRHLEVPGVAMWAGSQNLRYTFKSLFLSLLTKYRGRFYRDTSNQKPIGETFVSDMSGGQKLKLSQEREVEWRVRIENIFNFNKSTARSGSQSFRYPYSEIEGYPLPMRRWALEFAMRI